ncbi:MAG: tRNA-dihydrouridine synthase [Brevinematales bacterium]|nr:tRNA-dihydrouridine synthase [Brevinematales bacterium]
MSQKTLRIGEIEFPFWAGAAPLAGFSHRAYRDWMRQWGAGFVVSEMVSVEGLYRDQKKTWMLLDVFEEPLPWIQLFGKSEYAKWYTVARKVISRLGVRLIDVNFGCPVKKVVKTGAGSALLVSPRGMADIVRALKDAGAIATAKVRLGVETPLWEAFVPALEEAGVDAITVHGRYAVQMYAGVADWEKIKDIRQCYQGVLIGNGDITRPELAIQRKEESGVDGVMIGRAALGMPYIFRQIRDYVETGTYQKPSFEDIKEMLLEYASVYLQVNKTSTLVPIRGILLSMIHGIPHARHLRQTLSLVKTYEDLSLLLKEGGKG